MGDILNRAILMLVPVIHFLEDVSLVFLELSKSVRFDLLNFVSLSLQFGVKLLNQLTLLLLALFLLSDDGLFYLGALFSQVLKYFTLFLDTSVFLSLQIYKVLVHLIMDGVQLIIQTLNTIVAFLSQHILKILHTIFTTTVLALLVFVFCVKLVLHFCVKFLQLLIIADLICFE